MKKTIIEQNTDFCYFCGRLATDRHHVWHGTSNRKKADEDGLTVMLCHFCHMNLHDKGIGDRLLMQVGQMAWENTYGTREDFIRRYGKSVL